MAHQPGEKSGLAELLHQTIENRLGHGIQRRRRRAQMQQSHQARAEHVDLAALRVGEITHIQQRAQQTVHRTPGQAGGLHGLGQGQAAGLPGDGVEHGRVAGEDAFGAAHGSDMFH